MTLDCITLEKAGLPSVVIAAEFFREEVERLGKARGLPNLHKYIVPDDLEKLPAPELKKRVMSASEEIIGMLTSNLQGKA